MLNLQSKFEDGIVTVRSIKVDDKGNSVVG